MAADTPERGVTQGTLGASQQQAASAATNGTVASVEGIFAVDDLVEKQIPIPEWGGMVIGVRGLTRGELRRINEDDADAEVVNARAMALAMVKPKVTEAEAARILEEKGMAATKRITDGIMEASGMAPGFPEDS